MVIRPSLSGRSLSRARRVSTLDCSIGFRHTPFIGFRKGTTLKNDSVGIDDGAKAIGDIALVSARSIDVKSLIHVVRKQQVMLDSDLAFLYDVETKVFNQAVKRNERRFPDRFRFRLSPEEHGRLRSQTVTSNPGEAEGATSLTHSRSRASRCFRRFSASMSRSRRAFASWTLS